MFLNFNKKHLKTFLHLWFGVGTGGQGDRRPQWGSGVEPRSGLGAYPRRQIYIHNLQLTNAFSKQYGTLIK